MTKKIYVVRHAKSSWEDMTLIDKKRPLNSRGKRDAPKMAVWCKNNDIIPDKIISSTATRARATADIFKSTMVLGDAHFELEDNLYHAPAETYMEVCYRLEEEVKAVMMFGHNPGITELANIVGNDYIDNIPTCGILIMESTATSWQDVDINNCQLVNWKAPKLI